MVEKVRLVCKVPIKPVAKARPRVTRNGTYTPAPTRQAEADIRTYWLREHRHSFASDVPLRLDVTVWLPRPKSVKRAKPVTRPDEDNYLKLCQDALIGVAFHDDGQITDGRARKRYVLPGEDPCIVIVLEEDDEP